MRVLRGATCQLLTKRIGLWFIVSAFAAATTSVDAQVSLRGRLDRRDASGQLYPATGFAVTLRSPTTGVRSLAAYAGIDGFYYFSGVAPGQYQLEVWLPTSPPSPMLFNIQVPMVPQFDIFPILVPF